MSGLHYNPYYKNVGVLCLAIEDKIYREMYESGQREPSRYSSFRLCFDANANARVVDQFIEKLSDGEVEDLMMSIGANAGRFLQYYIEEHGAKALSGLDGDDLNHLIIKMAVEEEMYVDKAFLTEGFSKWIIENINDEDLTDGHKKWLESCKDE
jgi:hypothetical protein